MNIRSLFILLCLCVSNVIGGNFRFAGNINYPDTGNAEIIQYSQSSSVIVAASSANSRINFYQFSSVVPLEISKLDNFVPTSGEVTSVAVIPDLPAALAAVKGKRKNDRGVLLVIDLRKESLGKILMSQSLGICPDSIAVSPDGNWAVVANEAEEDPNTDGTISVFDLRKIKTIDDFVPALICYEITDLDKILNKPGGEIEPEFVCFDPQSRFAAVSCQENDAVLFIDLQKNKPFIAGSLLLPKGAMPDGISLIDDVEVVSQTYGLVLGIAQEGDSESLTSTGGQSVSFYWINPDNIEAGSILLWQSKIYEILKFNRNERFDPESITMFRRNKQVYAAVAIERLNSVLLLNITEPICPSIEDLITVGKKPEGVLFVDFHGIAVVISANESKDTPQLSVIAEQQSP